MSARQDLPEIKRPLCGQQSAFKMHPKTSEAAPPMSARLQPHQEELQLLGELGGIHMDGKVFRILVDFLNMGVDPNTIFAILKSMRRSPGRQSRSQLSSHS